MNIVKAIRSAVEYYQSGDLLKAEHFCKKILQEQPDNAEVLHFLGIICSQLQNHESAIQYLKRALKINTTNAEGYLALGMSFQYKGMIDDAIACYKKTLDLMPEYAEAHMKMGDAYKDKGLLNEAIQSYNRALHINPNLPEVYNNFGVALSDSGYIDEAVDSFQKAIQVNPADYSAYNNLGRALQIKGTPAESEIYYRRAVVIQPSDPVPHLNLLCVMNYNPRHDAQSILSEHVRFANQFEAPFRSSIPLHSGNRCLDHRLKIGYVSPDFKNHSVAYFIEPVLAAHSRDCFEIFCYANVRKEDDVTKRLQGYADQWRDITGISDDSASELIHRDGIDILVDLAGYTTSNRIFIFCRKPAPVQISWIGYPATTGLLAIDYKIVDSYTDPPGITESFYTEKLMRLPDCFLCYLPDKDSTEVTQLALPALTSGHITFGSFNNFAKVTPEAIGIWSEILKALPQSRIVLKAYNLSFRSTREYALKLFSQNGISADRVELVSFDLSRKEHLFAYNRVDIGLDTFPYNGTTTTCEALWMGVPVITLAGNTHVSRVGVSLLSNVGLPELIAKTRDEYTKIAICLASDIDQLKSLRGRLREMMKNSPLTDANSFTINLENCYWSMWEEWCRLQKQQKLIHDSR